MRLQVVSNTWPWGLLQTGMTACRRENQEVYSFHWESLYYGGQSILPKIIRQILWNGTTYYDDSKIYFEINLYSGMK